MALQHLRSSTANKRPTPAAMSDGQIAINSNTASPGLFFKDSAGALIKVGPVHVGTTAPNASPASGGETGNTVGEQWLDTTGGTYVFKVWDGSAWRSETGTFVDVNGDTMTGALGIIAGDASTPGLFFSGDTNTGIYSPGADQLAISTNGVGRVFIDASGKVGVGVSPSDTSGFGGTIDISGTTGAACYVRTNGSATNYGYIGHYGTDLYISNGSNGPIRFFTNTGERMRLDSSGRLGLGTSSAGDILHVKGGSTYAGVIADNSATTGGGAFRAYRNGVQKAIFCADSWVTGTSSDDAAIYADAGGGVKFYTNNSSTAKAYLTSGGSLGIGTTSPSQLFHLAANNCNLYLQPVSNAEARIQAEGGTAGTGTAITFHNYNGSANGERARIDSSGRLLVGTSTVTTTASTSTNNLLAVESANNYLGVSFTANCNDSNGSYLVLKKSRGTTAGSNTVVQSGDEIGNIFFEATDGSASRSAAAIRAFVDATPGASDMPGRLVFSTTADGASSPTERMRITSSGLHRHHSAEGVFRVNSSQGAGTTYELFWGGYGGSSTTSEGTNSIRIYTNGNIQNTNNSYGALSDIKLKENIVDANSQWDDLKALQVRKYNFKEGQTHTQIGLIAQEVELVSPGLVSESPDRDEEGNDLGTTTKSVNYSVLYMKAVKALQEAMVRIEVLEKRLTDAGIA